MLLNRIVVIVAKPCEYTKIHCTIHFKKVNFCYVNYILVKKQTKERFNGSSLQ